MRYLLLSLLLVLSACGGDDSEPEPNLADLKFYDYKHNPPKQYFLVDNEEEVVSWEFDTGAVSHDGRFKLVEGDELVVEIISDHNYEPTNYKLRALYVSGEYTDYFNIWIVL